MHAYIIICKNRVVILTHIGLATSVVALASENALLNSPIRSLYSGKPSYHFPLVGIVTGWCRYAFLIGLSKSVEKYVCNMIHLFTHCFIYADGN